MQEYIVNLPTQYQYQYGNTAYLNVDIIIA